MNVTGIVPINIQPHLQVCEYSLKSLQSQFHKEKQCYSKTLVRWGMEPMETCEAHQTRARTLKGERVLALGQAEESQIGQEVGQQQQQQQLCATKLLWITSCNVPSRRLPFSAATKLSKFKDPPRTQPIQPLSPKFEACTRWILRGPAHHKALLAWISLQEKMGWQGAGQAAAVSNWDTSRAATIEVVHSKWLWGAFEYYTDMLRDSKPLNCLEHVSLNIRGMEIFGSASLIFTQSCYDGWN